jgi:heme oxygenase
LKEPVVAQPATSQTPSARLKHETAELHKEAEHSPFQRALVKGELPLSLYVLHLEQLLLVHRGLEGRLRRLCADRPEVARIVRDYQFQEAYILEDLAHYGRTGEQIAAIEPIPAVAALLDEIESASRTRPLVLLGMHYVLEGSNNGGRFIAKAVRKAYALTPGGGDRYLDPYGESQTEHWQAFKADLDDAGHAPDEVEDLLEGARRMFEGIKQVGDGVLERGEA